MVARLDARLQAMAAAQDLLVRSETDAADLEELLRSEIAQMSGALVNLSGPVVQLDAQQTHALALVFHELATNALKYGAASQDLGHRDITWTVERGPSGHELRILWQESMAAAVKPSPGPNSGFGSRLLAILIEGELGGRIERHLQTDGLTVDPTPPFCRGKQERATFEANPCQLATILPDVYNPGRDQRVLWDYMSQGRKESKAYGHTSTAPYVAAKHAIVGLTRGAVLDYAPKASDSMPSPRALSLRP